MSSMTLIDHALAERNTRASLQDGVLVLMGSLLIALSAQLSFYLPISPIPITGQTFMVLLCAAVLGRTRGTLAVLAYIVEGVCGLPFFAGGVGGFVIFRGPTLGYIVGFLVAAYWVGFLAERKKERSFLTALPAFLQGYIIIFLFGLAWLTQFLPLPLLLTQGLFVFLPGEILKMLLLSLVLPAAWKFVR